MVKVIDTPRESEYFFPGPKPPSCHPPGVGTCLLVVVAVGVAVVVAVVVAVAAIVN